MSETDPPAPKPSPLSFALGSLTERVHALTEEQALSRKSYEGLPDRIVLLLSPRLTALESTDKNHEVRIVALEKAWWKVIGGGMVLLAIGGIVIGHPIK